MDAFAQQLDTARPHQLLSQNPKREGQLRVAALRWEAAELREKAERTEKFPDTRLSLAARKQRAARIRARADEILREAALLGAH